MFTKAPHKIIATSQYSINLPFGVAFNIIIVWLFVHMAVFLPRLGAP